MKLAPPPALLRHKSSAPSTVPAAPSTVPAAAKPAPAPVEDGSFTFRSTTWQADGFGFDATTGEFFTASPTALLVMQCLADHLSASQILERIITTFDVSRRSAERDLEAFLAELTTLGLHEAC